MVQAKSGATRTVISLQIGSLIGLLIVLVAGSAPLAWADTINWPFTTAANYTVSDATKVEVADGVAKLIAIDQTDDDNTSTGFGGGTHNETQWDGTNNWLELTTTGETNGSGDFISRVMDAGGTAAWDSISWTPQRPLYKELPNSKGQESGYPEGNADMTGNVLLMHMNEASGTVVDYSGEGNNGTTYGGVTYGATGKLNTALSFDGVDNYVETLSNELKTADNFTISVWFKANNTQGSHHIIWQGPGTQNGWGGPGDANTHEMHLTIGRMSTNDRLVFFYGYEYATGDWAPAIEIDIPFSDTTNWNHAVVTMTNAGTSPSAELFLNGVSQGTDTGTLTGRTPWDTNLRIGRPGADQRYFDGTIDEVTIYNRALLDQEILDHYRRGALRLKYQVRSGSSSPPTGDFIGPDSTTGTYYSELSNNTTGLPSLSLTNVDNNQYFQYKAYLETDNSSYSPELKSVVIGPEHYPGDNPTVQNNTGQAYVALGSFAETLGAGNAGSAKYQISDDGTDWYYWNASNWVTASGYSQTNTAAEVSTNCGQFDDDVGKGDFYFKAFLHSDAAAQQVELDQVDLGYTPIVISVSVSDSTFTFGTNPLNTWLTPQTSVITNDGTVAEDFIGRISQFTDGSNTWEISSTANGADTTRAQWSTASETGPWNNVSAYDADFTIATNLAVNDSVTLWFRIETPTGTSSYDEHSSTLTVTAQEY